MAESEQAPVTAATEISFCPHLRLYHYRRADGSDYLFDDVKLEEAVDGYIKQGDPRQADFMAVLTAMARKYPHQVVAFNAEGKCFLRDLQPVAPPSDEGEEIGTTSG
jgi:hypothetical protein